jgi:hypothetical protein
MCLMGHTTKIHVGVTINVEHRCVIATTPLNGVAFLVYSVDRGA